ADTNNHAIRLLEGNEIRTLRLTGLNPPQPPFAKGGQGGVGGVGGFLLPGAKKISLPIQTLSLNSAGEVVIDIRLPEGYSLSPLAPFLYSIDSGGSLVTEREKEVVRLEAPNLPLRIPFKTPEATPEFPLKVSVTFYYCREDGQGVCLGDSVVWSAPVKLSAQGGTTTLKLGYAPSVPF
ncbi:MAG: hypothetical protein ACK4WF_00860, partial [Candidatus Brocadiales bacterium]